MEIELIDKYIITIKGFCLLKEKFTEDNFRMYVNCNPDLVYDLFISGIETKMNELDREEKTDIYLLLKDESKYCRWFQLYNYEREEEAKDTARFVYNMLKKFNTKEELQILYDLLNLDYNHEMSIEQEFEIFLENPNLIIFLNEDDYEFDLDWKDRFQLSLKCNADKPYFLLD